MFKENVKKLNGLIPFHIISAKFINPYTLYTKVYGKYFINHTKIFGLPPPSLPTLASCMKIHVSNYASGLCCCVRSNIMFKYKTHHCHGHHNAQVMHIHFLYIDRAYRSFIGVLLNCTSYIIHIQVEVYTVTSGYDTRNAIDMQMWCVS